MNDNPVNPSDPSATGQQPNPTSRPRTATHANEYHAQTQTQAQPSAPRQNINDINPQAAPAAAPIAQQTVDPSRTAAPAAGQASVSGQTPTPTPTPGPSAQQPDSPAQEPQYQSQTYIQQNYGTNPQASGHPSPPPEQPMPYVPPAPKPRKKSRTKWLFALIGLVAAALLAGGAVMLITSSSDDDDSKDDSSQQDKDQDSNDDSGSDSGDSSQSDGDEIESDAILNLRSSDDDGNLTSASISVPKITKGVALPAEIYANPKSGYEFAIVEIAVQNDSQASQPLSSTALYFTDQDGNKYKPHYASSQIAQVSGKVKIDLNQTLGPNQSDSGHIVIEIPESTSSLNINYDTGLNAADDGEAAAEAEEPLSAQVF